MDISTQSIINYFAKNHLQEGECVKQCAIVNNISCAGTDAAHIEIGMILITNLRLVVLSNEITSKNFICSVVKLNEITKVYFPNNARLSNFRIVSDDLIIDFETHSINQSHRLMFSIEVCRFRRARPLDREAKQQFYAVVSMRQGSFINDTEYEKQKQSLLLC